MSLTTTINMPLVRTPMIAHVRFTRTCHFLLQNESPHLILQTRINRPARVATHLDSGVQLLHVELPRITQILMNTTFRIFPDSTSHQRRSVYPVVRSHCHVGNDARHSFLNASSCHPLQTTDLISNFALPAIINIAC